MFNKLTCKVRFHIAVGSLSKYYESVYIHWKLSSNQRKTNRFPAKFAREALTKSTVLYQSFFSETGLENSREIPAKSAVFSANLSLKIPRNLTFFFRDLPEALSLWCWTSARSAVLWRFWSNYFSRVYRKKYAIKSAFHNPPHEFRPGDSLWEARSTFYGLKTRSLYLLRCSALKAPQKELLWYLLEYCAS